MTTLPFLAIAILAAAANGASLLSEQARNLANPGPLLKRCPCVPINTCYAQGVSLNEQDFLNTHFECPDYTQNHCCGPYFPTLGSDDFYFDEAGQGKQLLAGFSNTGEAVMIVMAQNVTTEDPELRTTPGVMTVLAETSSTTTTTTEATTTEVDDFSTTTVEVETTTETATEEEATTSTEIVTTPKPKLRLPKTNSRRVLPRFERKSTRRSPTTTEPSTTTPTSPSSSSTATTETLRRLPTRRTLYRADFRQRLIGSRFRSTTTSTVATTAVAATE